MEVTDRKREVERLIEATKGSRNEVRDPCLLLLMFRRTRRKSDLRHGTRGGEKTQFVFLKSDENDL
jgi:hypothetical protein